MSLFSFISDIFKPAAELVDKLHVSDAERMQLRNELVKIQSGMHEKSIDLMKAEASSDHWIVAAVRPICTLILFILILCDAYGLADAPPQVYDLAQMYMGIYAGGRSLEKISNAVMKVKGK